MGNTAQQCSLVCCKTLILQETFEDSKSTSGGILCLFESHTFCDNKLDVQETDFSFAQFYGSWFFSMHVYTWMGFPLSIFGIQWLKNIILHQTKTKKIKDVREPMVKLVGKDSTKHAKTNSNKAHQSRPDQHWSRSIQRNTFWSKCYVVCLWGQWRRD